MKKWIAVINIIIIVINNIEETERRDFMPSSEIEFVRIE
jgi:hypothetical protein